MALPMPIPSKPPWYSTPTAIVPLPTAVLNCNSPIESPPDSRPATENYKNKSYDNIENNNDRPDDDDNNDDVDCFHQQEKQPVLPQDIPPSVPTANANNTSPRFIEMNNYNYNYNRRRNTPAKTKRSAYRGFKTKTKPTHTILPEAPLLVWDGTQYQLDYTHNHRPSVSVWDGTTHTDIVYDDYDCRTDDYAHKPYRKPHHNTHTQANIRRRQQ